MTIRLDDFIHNIYLAPVLELT